MPKITGLIKKGDGLDSYTLGDPTFGWKHSDDGFGLKTMQATYVKDKAWDGGLTRNGSCTIEGYEYLNIHKWSVMHDGLKLLKITVDFAGIDPNVNEGIHTNCQVTVSNGLSTEPITAHPNFLEVATGFDEVIAGAPDYTESDLGPTVTDTNGRKGKSFLGENGACFERKTGGRFIGFVDPSKKTLYGKTSYLAPVTQFAGVIYIQKSNPFVLNFNEMLGTSSNLRNWMGNLPPLLPDYLGGDEGSYYTADNGDYQLLLSQANFEDFGMLVKVSYEIRFSKEGWDPKVYRKATT